MKTQVGVRARHADRRGASDVGQPKAANIETLLLGDCTEKERLQAEASSLGLTDVVFVDTVPMEQVADYLRLLDTRSSNCARLSSTEASCLPSFLSAWARAWAFWSYTALRPSRPISACGKRSVGLDLGSHNTGKLLTTINTLRGSLSAQCRANCLAVAKRYDRLGRGHASGAAGRRSALKQLGLRRGDNRMTLPPTYRFSGSRSDRKRQLATESSYGSTASVREFTTLLVPVLT